MQASLQGCDHSFCFVPMQVMVRKDVIDGSALFLYRKPDLESPARPLFLPAPPAEACEGAMDGWLKEYREKLAEVGGFADRNPYATGKGAFPGNRAPAACLSTRP